MSFRGDGPGKMRRYLVLAPGAILAVGVTATILLRGQTSERAPIDVLCEQRANPGMGSTTFEMSFTVRNRGHATATALVFEIGDTDLNGRPIGEPSTYTLTGRFAPETTVEVTKDDVEAPRNWRPLKLSKLDCTLQHAVFDDGSRR